jgi:hypothetical protein
LKTTVPDKTKDMTEKEASRQEEQIQNRERKIESTQDVIEHQEQNEGFKRLVSPES